MMLLSACLFTLAPVLAPQAEPARLLRFPHIQGDKLAFVYGGDIWTSAASGGPARRVTSFDEGFELFPRISPDGQWIAFSGEYTGTRQIWLVPYAGGLPRQLTFYPDVGQLPPRGGYDNLPLEWSADGRRLLIRTNRTPYDERISRYYWVDPFGGGLEVPLEQIPEGGPASLSPDGKQLAYNIISREWRTWKRYKAGRAQDVWIYDLERNTVERITDWVGTDNFPMWIGGRIYFTSDRTGTLELYRYDLATRATRRSRARATTTCSSRATGRAGSSTSRAASCGSWTPRPRPCASSRSRSPTTGPGCGRAGSTPRRASSAASTSRRPPSAPWSSSAASSSTCPPRRGTRAT